MLLIFAVAGVGLGALLGLGVYFASSWLWPTPIHAGMLVAGLAGLGGFGFTLLYWLFLPSLVKELATAETRRQDILELVAHDNKSYFIRVKSDGNILVPADRRWKDRLILVTTPEAATPISGMRSRLIRAIVDHPVVLDPVYISVIVDFRRRYGFENLAELLEADKYYNRLDEMKILLSRLREELERAEKEEGEYKELSPEERENIKHDLRRQIRVYEKLLENIPEDKPIAIVRGRVWTADDVLGWLGYRMPSMAVRQLVKLKETEGFLRARVALGDIMKYLLLGMMVFGIVTIIVVALLLGLGGQHASSASIQALPNITGIGHG